MDPTEALRQIRKLYMLQYPTEEDVVQLAQLICNLDEFIVKSEGTFLPDQWRPAPKPPCNVKYGILSCAREVHPDAAHIDPNGRIWHVPARQSS